MLVKIEILRRQTKFGVWPLAPGHGLFVSRWPPYSWTDNLRKSADLFYFHVR